MNYQKVKAKKPTKKLANHLINKFSILNWSKYFSSEIFQNCLVFKLGKKHIKYFKYSDWFVEI